MDMRNKGKVCCVIPTIAQDYQWSGDVMFRYIHHLPVNRILFIGPEELKEQIDRQAEKLPCKDGKETEIGFIREEDILDREAVKKAYDKRKDELLTADKNMVCSSFGWYYQQFLKISYALLCEEDYYLCWDMDTIPLKPIELFHEDGRPYLDIKQEYHESYFRTIEKLFGYGKQIGKSFISEHMLFHVSFMRDMIREIEESSLEGGTFYEKVFSAMDTMDLGFSEFETYGSWIANRFPDAYRLRYWKSFRNINFLINLRDLTDEDVAYLSKDYDAASFEKYHETEPQLTELFRNPRYREKLSAERFYHELLEMGCFGEYKDGMIHTQRGSFPV